MDFFNSLLPFLSFDHTSSCMFLSSTLIDIGCQTSSIPPQQSPPYFFSTATKDTQTDTHTLKISSPAHLFPLLAQIICLLGSLVFAGAFWNLWLIIYLSVIDSFYSSPLSRTYQLQPLSPPPSLFFHTETDVQSKANSPVSLCFCLLLFHSLVLRLTHRLVLDPFLGHS